MQRNTRDTERSKLVALDRLTLPPLDAQRRYSIKIACAYLDISHTSLYQRIRVGEIKTIKDGIRRYVPGSEIVRLSRLPESA